MHWSSVDTRSKLLYFIRQGERRLCISRSPELIQLIVHELHVVLLGAHSGFMNVYEDIRKLLYWKKMREKYRKVHQDLSSQQALSTGHLKTNSNDASVLPIPQSPWQSISLDFITELPKSQGYDSIVVVLCYLSKMADFIQLLSCS